MHDERTLAAWGVHRTQFHGISGAVLMSSRGGQRFDRTFMESFIRPGLDPRAWTARSNIPATGILPTGPAGISIHVATHYTLPDHHLRRHVLRTDGFAPVNAPYSGGELLTRPVRFSGASLRLNYATSAAGEIRVELQHADGRPIRGLALEDSPPLVGDTIAGEVSWRSHARLAAIAGQPVRLRFAMRDADLYSLQFTAA